MIKDIRKELDKLRNGPLTVVKMAERSGLDPVTLWRSLQTYNNPKLSILEALAKCGLLDANEKGES